MVSAQYVAVAMLNKFVLREGDDLVNLVSKKRLAVSSDLSLLRDNFFLIGQDRECLESRLFMEPKSFEIKLVTTWECNLRCSHCFVLHQLVKKDKSHLDQGRFYGFLSRYLDSFGGLKKGRIQFIGGEAALTARRNVDVMNFVEKTCKDRGVDIKFHTNTNCYDLNDDIIEYYDRLTEFTVSLDGPKHLHDAQRKAVGDKSSAFDRTIANIRTLVSLGMRDKIRIQAAVSDEGMTEESILSFYKTLLMNGVLFKNIKYSLSVPTKTHEPGERFKEARRKPFPMPCCKYRWMGDFTVCNDNKDYCDYFDISEKNRLGSLDDSMDDLAARHRSIIMSMPAMNDPKCQKCPVIGLCWGNCCNLNGLYKPSELCDAEGLYENARVAAAEGRLSDFMYRRTE